MNASALLFSDGSSERVLSVKVIEYPELLRTEARERMTSSGGWAGPVLTASILSPTVGLNNCSAISSAGGGCS